MSNRYAFPVYLLIITADTNDADYVTSQRKVTEDEIKRIERICKVIKTQRNHNWDTRWDFRDEEDAPEVMYKDKLSQEDIEWFNSYLPCGEYGIHTIKKVEVIETISDIQLL